MPTDHSEEAFGSAIERREDAALVTDEAEYTVDISLPEMARRHPSQSVRPRPNREHRHEQRRDS